MAMHLSALAGLPTTARPSLVGRCMRSPRVHVPSLPARVAARRLHSNTIRAVAAPEALTQLNPNNVPIPQLDDETRAAVAEQLGYRSIGKELPDGVTLGQIVKSMPSDVFELNPLRAWGAVITSIVSMAAALYLISISPWYMLPFAWAFAGTAFTGFFVVGHDCGHRSFSKNKLVEVCGLGGMMMMMMLFVCMMCVVYTLYTSSLAHTIPPFTNHPQPPSPRILWAP